MHIPGDAEAVPEARRNLQYALRIYTMKIPTDKIPTSSDPAAR
jgi:hypothetical protein